MANLTKILGMLSLLVLVFGLLINGIVGLNTAGVLLVIGIIILAASENAAKIIVSLAGFLLFVWTISKGNIREFEYISYMCMGLLVILSGLYIMVKPLFNSNDKSNNHK